VLAISRRCVIAQFDKRAAHAQGISAAQCGVVTEPHAQPLADACGKFAIAGVVIAGPGQWQQIKLQGLGDRDRIGSDRQGLVAPVPASAGEQDKAECKCRPDQPVALFARPALQASAVDRLHHRFRRANAPRDPKFQQPCAELYREGRESGLAGFRSRWMTWRRCAASSPRASWRVISNARSGVNLCSSLSNRSSDGPAT
jgi:hypothetical protein